MTRNCRGDASREQRVDRMVGGLREVLSVALELLHTTTKERDRSRGQLAALRDELRSVRRDRGGTT